MKRPEVRTCRRLLRHWSDVLLQSRPEAEIFCLRRGKSLNPIIKIITKMKKKALFLFSVVALTMTSCASVGTEVGSGGLYTGVESGLGVTSNTVGQKVGTSSAINVLGIYAGGNAGINAAARSAGITKISHVDHKKMSVLGLFAKYTTVVYGE